MTKAIKELINQINDIDNGDDTIGVLKDAMDYYCSNWDICEGYKRAIILTLEDQYNNHESEQESDDIVKLKNILNI